MTSTGLGLTIVSRILNKILPLFGTDTELNLAIGVGVNSRSTRVTFYS